MIENSWRLSQLILVARRWWWLVVVAVVVAGGASYTVTKREPRTYQASSRLFVNPASTTGSIGSGSDTQTALMLATSIADMINSYRLADKVLQTTHLDTSATAILGEMTASADLATPIITITVRDHIPARAATLANAAAADIVALNQSDQSLRYGNLKTTLEQQIARANTQLTSASSRLRALSLRQTNDAGTLTEISGLTTQVNGLQSSVIALNTQLNALLLSQAQSNTVLNIIDHARVPTDAVSPIARTNVLLAVFIGLVLSGGVIMLMEYLDDSLRSAETVEKQLGIPVLSVISRFRHSDGDAIVANKRRDTNAEAFKTLRTNIQFVNVDRPPRIVMVASGRPSEGKSTIAANYAVAVAHAGKAVILVDCDLRRPSLQRIFLLEPGPGLTDYLRDTRIGLSIARQTQFDNLRVVSSGPIPPNPSELLGSQRMTDFLAMASEHADLVVIDTPPGQVVTDASVLAPHVDGIVLVVDEEKTKMRAATLTCQTFKMVGGKIIGIVVNKFDTRHAGYGGYYYYQYGGYYGPDKDDGNIGDAKVNSGTGMKPEPVSTKLA